MHKTEVIQGRLHAHIQTRTCECAALVKKDVVTEVLARTA